MVVLKIFVVQMKTKNIMVLYNLSFLLKGEEFTFILRINLINFCLFFFCETYFVILGLSYFKIMINLKYFFLKCLGQQKAKDFFYAFIQKRIFYG